MKHFNSMDMKFLNYTFIVGLLFIAASCLGPKAVSTLESNTYDDKTNQTTFNKFPFGTLSLPGKWTKTYYNNVSGQHNFKNADSTWCAIAINQCNGYPFYKNKMSSNTFVKEMYEWDSSYLVQQINGKRMLIKQDTANHFITWRLTGGTGAKKVDSYYLFGSEKGIIFTVTVGTEKWSEEQKISFIENVYKNKTVGNCCN